MPPSVVPAPTPSSWRARLPRHAGLVVVLLAFSAVVVPTLDQGVGNLDSHRILISVQTLADQHQILPMRQPGHPTTAFYVFGAAGWLLRHAAGVAFSPAIYCTLQWLLALLAASAFYLWLLRARISPPRAALAVACLVFSTHFLLQTLDGEEFITGILLLLGAAALLQGDGAGPPSRRRLAASIGLFALATGCRAELVFAGVALYPLCFLLRRVTAWQTWVGTAAATAGAIVIVWLPVILLEGLNNPDPGMTLLQSILAWGYKLLFVCYGFPLSLVLFGVLAWSVARLLRAPWSRLGPADYSVAASALIATLLLGLYVFHPHKPSIALSSLPFLLTLAALRHRLILGSVALLTAASLGAHVEIFRERVLTRPYLAPGGYARATESKPINQLGYLRALARIPVETKSVIVGDVFSWVLEYHVDRGTMPAPTTVAPSRSGARNPPAPAHPNSLLRIAPRESAMTPRSLVRLHRHGDAILMDRLLWRTLFARYDVTPLSGDTVMIDDVPVRLVTIVPEP